MIETVLDDEKRGSRRKMGQGGRRDEEEGRTRRRKEGRGWRRDEDSEKKKKLLKKIEKWKSRQRTHHWPRWALFLFSPWMHFQTWIFVFSMHWKWLKALEKILTGLTSDFTVQGRCSLRNIDVGRMVRLMRHPSPAIGILSSFINYPNWHTSTFKELLHHN